jgi:imidazolonepropionase
MAKIIGPFHQLLTLESLPLRGKISNDKLEIITNGAVLTQDDKIVQVGDYDTLLKTHSGSIQDHTSLTGKLIGLPGFIDAHTHICFGGSRHKDFSSRNSGSSYQEIAAKGGGIWDTVTQTRNASAHELFEATKARAQQLLDNGITTAEVKSGYGLRIDQELKQLKCVQEVNNNLPIDLVATCLAAHINPKDFEGSNEDYLEYILHEIVPAIKTDNLAGRFDIFVEQGAFTVEEARKYLIQLKNLGFDITIHGDQFTTGGSKLAAELGALSVDHLEHSGEKEIEILSKSHTVATVLPGASLGLGEPFAPARQLLDSGAILAIASDWNPGSAPMGNLLTQAGILSSFEKLSDAEVFAGITFRAATALGINDIGRIKNGFMADIIGFEAEDFREILYHQGQLSPKYVWKKGNKV